MDLMTAVHGSGGYIKTFRPQHILFFRTHIWGKRISPPGCEMSESETESESESEWAASRTRTGFGLSRRLENSMGIRHPSSVLRRPSSVVRRPSSVVRPPSPVPRPPPQLGIHRPERGCQSEILLEQDVQRSGGHAKFAAGVEPRRNGAGSDKVRTFSCRQKSAHVQ